MAINRRNFSDEKFVDASFKTSKKTRLFVVMYRKVQKLFGVLLLNKMISQWKIYIVQVANLLTDDWDALIYKCWMLIYSNGFQEKIKLKYNGLISLKVVMLIRLKILNYCVEYIKLLMNYAMNKIKNHSLPLHMKNFNQYFQGYDSTNTILTEQDLLTSIYSTTKFQINFVFIIFKGSWN